MTEPTDDPLAQRLAELPEARLDPRVARAIHKQARTALEGRRAERLTHLWTSVLLPAVLVTCATMYTVDAAMLLKSIYVVSASR